MEDVMSESQKERQHYENSDLGGRKILKCILKKQRDSMDSIHLVQDMNQ
jgi:hypothetical protein